MSEYPKRYDVVTKEVDEPEYTEEEMREALESIKKAMEERNYEDIDPEDYIPK